MWEPVFVVGVGVPVTATMLLDEMHVEYSSSQLKREKEADTFTYFSDFLHGLESSGEYLDEKY